MYHASCFWNFPVLRCFWKEVLFSQIFLHNAKILFEFLIKDFDLVEMNDIFFLFLNQEYKQFWVIISIHVFFSSLCWNLFFLLSPPFSVLLFRFFSYLFLLFLDFLDFVFFRLCCLLSLWKVRKKFICSLFLPLIGKVVTDWTEKEKIVNLSQKKKSTTVHHPTSRTFLFRICGKRKRNHQRIRLMKLDKVSNKIWKLCFVWKNSCFDFT